MRGRGKGWRMVVGQPGTLCQPGGRTCRAVARRAKAEALILPPTAAIFSVSFLKFKWSPKSLRQQNQRNFPHVFAGKRRRGWATPKNYTPKALSRRRTAHPRRSGRRSATAGAAEQTGEQWKTGYNTAKGAAGGLNDVARNEPLRKGCKPSDRPSN